MAREYMITKTREGTDLQITEEGQSEEHVKLQAVSDAGIIREAEGILRERYFEGQTSAASTGRDSGGTDG